MSCYNFQYTGMPEYSGRDSSMDMSGWQRSMGSSVMSNSGMGGHAMNSSIGSSVMSNSDMGGHAMNSSMGSSVMSNSDMGGHAMNSSMGSNAMSRGADSDSMSRNVDSDSMSKGMNNGSMRMPGWPDWRPGQNPAPGPVRPPESCLDSGALPLAMSYVPMQRWTQPLPIDRAMDRGTIFKELDLPFMMGRCR